MRRCKVCNEAAAQNDRLAQPVPTGTRLLSASQVLSQLGVNAANKIVARATAVLTTYGTLHAKDPALAASLTINPQRPVYLVTQWFAKPVVVQVPSPPMGISVTGTVTGAQYVVDAATGQVTDETP